MNEENKEQLTNTTGNLEQGINGTANMNAADQISSTPQAGQPIPNMAGANNIGINSNIQTQNESLDQGMNINNSASAIHQTTQQTATAPSNNDFSGVIDPSKITVGPEAINPQIPVDNPHQQNLSVDNESKNETSQKNNTFSLILVFLLFVGVGAFIWFMPEIRQILNDKKPTEQQQTSQKPEENKDEENPDHYDSMICSQIANTYTIYSQEEKVKKYSKSIEYTKELDANYQSCLTLQQSEVNGFVVGCNKTANSVTVVKTYDFSILSDTFTTDDLDIKKDADVKTIKTNLEKKGYTCS